MSEIQRYRPVIGHDGFPTLWPDPSGKAVKFADHETAIALTARVCAEAFEAELADAKARVEGLRQTTSRIPIDQAITYNRAIDHALAALTQPQTEKMCPVCRNVGPPGYNCSECDGGGAATEKCPEDCDGFGQLIGDSDGPCPACSGLESDGGGAATAAGVADADLVRVGDFFGLPAFTHPDVKPGIVGIVSAGEVTATITGTAPQRPGDAMNTTSNNTGYMMNLTYGVNDKCPDGQPHSFWFHWIDGYKIDQCTKCGQSAETGEIPYA